jgi:hypothetical protein
MGDLSNYELLCFVGSQSAASIRQSFLSLRPQLFKQQRPFKFHYYNVTDLKDPAKEWPGASGFYKCKIILISVDELVKPVDKDEYRNQIKTFVGHVLRAIPDETFPVWLLTNNQPPMRLPAAMYAPDSTTLNKSSNSHPYNDVLFELFETSAFPDRVHLLDNTDLVAPWFNENPQDVLAVIAMRVFALTGHQVKAWRRAGQKGTKEGLLRDGKVEPNPPQVAYEHWIEPIQ